MWEFNVTRRDSILIVPLENPTFCANHKVELAHIGDSHTGQGSTRLENWGTINGHQPAMLHGERCRPLAPGRQP
jgi:hypothetical protein